LAKLELLLWFFFVEAKKALNKKILRLPILIGRTIGDTMGKPQPNFHEDLLEQLKDPEFVAEYLEAALEESDMPDVFLLALRNVAEAKGMTQLARETELKRESLYTMLSERGNPVLSSLYAILDALNLRLSVVRKEAA
jgi:probable addiction module antidote protein